MRHRTRTIDTMCSRSSLKFSWRRCSAPSQSRSSASPPFPVHAAMPSWNGKYSLVRYAVDKSGTSVAASQAEPTFSADYVFVTSCSTGKCVATATDGPTPKNPTLPQPSHYTWDGTRWVEHFDFQWDCYMGEGRSESVGTREVVGVLHTSAGRVVARYLAHRHQQRAVSRLRRNAGGGVCRGASITAAALAIDLVVCRDTSPLSARTSIHRAPHIENSDAAACFDP